MLGARERAALRLTDAIIGEKHSLTEEAKASLREHFSDAEIMELSLGVGLFLSLSKVLITLGLEPESMPLTVYPTPS